MNYCKVNYLVTLFKKLGTLSQWQPIIHSKQTMPTHTQSILWHLSTYIRVSWYQAFILQRIWSQRIQYINPWKDPFLLTGFIQQLKQKFKDFSRTFMEKNYFSSTAASKFKNFSSTFKDLPHFQALSTALNFKNRIQALYEPCIEVPAGFSLSHALADVKLQC